MTKRLATSALGNLVKRFRYDGDDDVFFEPDGAVSSSATTNTTLFNETFTKTKHDGGDADAGNVMVDGSTKTTTAPSVNIQYQEGFPKLLFQDLQSDNAEAVLEAATTLDDMLSAVDCSSTDLKTFLTLGGHAVLVTTMQKWSQNAEIQSRLVGCIASIVILHNEIVGDGSSTDLVSALLTMGALDQITVGALASFPSSSRLQLDGMIAVSCLCGRNHKTGDVSMSSRAAAKRFVNELDGVALVTKAMRVFSGVQDVQEKGCRLLNGLCIAGGQTEALIIKSKALTVVAASVQSYPDNEGIEQDAHDLMNAVLTTTPMKKKKKPIEEEEDEVEILD